VLAVICNYITMHGHMNIKLISLFKRLTSIRYTRIMLNNVVCLRKIW